ncbi:uncharacterized protein LOC116298355 [Actinia tenebrosa]|uniref:Uncharacterized protein LOC116298355 n=1 Tax=Actinia tenebrosa TaxID=6105 RepID=A0A6P8IB74_ACTTE|nr:uncharacterized protein LOC116298355 [Actinia tenebrosa]
MVLCLFVDCNAKSGRDKGISFFRVPTVIKNQGEEAEELSIERRTKWISAMSRADLTETVVLNNRVCSRHFVSGSPAASWDRYNVDWVPTLHLGKPQVKVNAKDDAETVLARSERARSCRKKRIELAEQEMAKKRLCLQEKGETVRSIIFTGPESKNNDLSCFVTDNITSETQTDMQTNDSDSLDTFEYQEPKSQEASTQTEVTETFEASTQSEEFEYMYTKTIHGFTENDFQDDEKVNFYTGLPSYEILHFVFEHVSPFVSRRSQVLSRFQEFIIVLIKLRLDVPLQDLAYRFNVSLPTVSRTFKAWLAAMDVRLSPLLHWPDRESLIRTMPQCFQFSFGTRTTVIIDCFELFIEKPTNLLARAQTFSSYKHHNTIKVLVGVTPQGTICFVSEAWGGRTSDKFLTENSGILEKLVPGDMVMADRGFTIHESVAFKRAKLVIPAFTKGKKQLDPFDVEHTRGIANVRIHVERVIGLLRRKFTILQGTLPTDFLMSNPDSIPLIDNILRVCSALVNLCPPIVPFD